MQIFIPLPRNIGPVSFDYGSNSGGRREGRRLLPVSSPGVGGRQSRHPDPLGGFHTPPSASRPYRALLRPPLLDALTGHR
jgi:hypothetical protein